MALHAITVIATFYCLCSICTGHTHGITKSGTHGKPGRTIACDRSWLGRVLDTPWGPRVCEDTGGKVHGNHIDILVASHEQAMRFGRQIVKVKVLGKKTLDQMRKAK